MGRSSMQSPAHKRANCCGAGSNERYRFIRAPALCDRPVVSRRTARVRRAGRERLAARVRRRAGKARIFYDAWHEGLIIGYASNRKLQNIYATESDLIVPFFCQDYRNKKWCGVELRAIEQLLFDQEYDRVLPFRFDHVEIPGSFRTRHFSDRVRTSGGRRCPPDPPSIPRAPSGQAGRSRAP